MLRGARHLMCLPSWQIKIPPPPNVRSPAAFREHFITPVLSQALLQSTRKVKRSSSTGQTVKIEATRYYSGAPEVPRHFGINQRKKAEFYVLEIHAQPDKGFYLSFSYLYAENCVEVHFKPQMGTFGKLSVERNQESSRTDDFIVDSQTSISESIYQKVEGQAMFDSRHGIYKRLYIDAIGDIIAVFEQRQPLHERFSVDGERRVGFRKTKNGSYKLYLCGNQFRLPGCPKIEATITFDGEDIVRLRHFFQRALRVCILHRMGFPTPFIVSKGKSNEKLHDEVKECLACQKKGHYFSECPLAHSKNSATTKLSEQRRLRRPIQKK